MSAANRVTAEEVERVLAEHEPWIQSQTQQIRCGCGWREPAEQIYLTIGDGEKIRAHVAAHILKLLRKEGEKE